MPNARSVMAGIVSKRQARRTIVALPGGILLACLAVSQAQSENLLPPQFSGVWVQGSCENPDRTRLLNPVGIIDLIEAGGVDYVQFFFIERVVGKGTDEVSLQLAAPGTPDRPSIDLALVNGKLDGIWTACLAQPQKLLWAFGDGMAAFRALGEIRAACQTDDRACVDTVWSHADVTGDGKLSHAELARVARGFGFFAAYAFHQKAMVRADEMIVPMALVPVMARYFVDTLIDNSDYDGDGFLTIEELMQDRGDPNSVIGLVGALGPAGAQAGVVGISTAVHAVMKSALGLLSPFR